jgi:GTP-binding protein
MRTTLTLELTAYTKDQLIARPLPQVALAGRSNVGKSSLINALAGRKGLAKVSSTPGKTKSINFFLVSPGNFFLVDLPGYGYAQASKTDRAKWARLIETYLAGPPRPMAVAVLLDSRLSPQRSDLDMCAWLGAAGVPLLAVLTKADKCKQTDREARRKQWAALLPEGSRVLVASAKTGLGIKELWVALFSAAGAPAPIPEPSAE